MDQNPTASAPVEILKEGQRVAFVDIHGLGQHHGIKHETLGTITANRDGFDAMVARLEAFASRPNISDDTKTYYQERAKKLREDGPKWYGVFGYHVTWDDGTRSVVQAIALEPVQEVVKP